MKIIKYTLLSCFGVIGFLLLSVFLLQHSHTFITLQTAHQNQYSFYIWRYLLIILIVMTWPKLIKIVGHYHKWDKALVTAMIKKRWWVLGFFVAMELLIIWGQ